MVFGPAKAILLYLAREIWFLLMKFFIFYVLVLNYVA